MALNLVEEIQGITNRHFRYSINIDKNQLFSIPILLVDYYRKLIKKTIAKAGVIIDFDRLFKLSSISVDFYQRNTSFLLTSTCLDLRAAKLLKMSLKIVVVRDKIKRQIPVSKLAEVR